MDSKNVMIDLETLGKKPGCVVLTIGLATFDSLSVRNTCRITVDLQDSLKKGMAVDASTIKWWLTQSEEARSALFKGNSVSVYSACNRIIKFFDECAIKNVRVWGNGASFDQPILTAMFESVGIRPPWKYSKEMCFRTISNLYFDTDRVMPDVAHDCVSDAVAQARTLTHMCVNSERLTNLIES